MKQYIHIIGLIISLFAWNSCNDEDLVKKNQNVVDGIPTTVSLSFATQDADKVTTRSELDPTEEQRVYNLMIFVFKNVGNDWVTEKIVKQESLLGQGQDDEGRTTGTVTLEITSGIKRIYAIANGLNNPLMPVANIEAVQNIADLEALTAVMSAGSVDRGQSNLLMSGSFVADSESDGTGTVAVDPEYDKKTIPGAVKLERVDSKIKFNVTTAEGISFTPKEWKVYNVPLKTYIIGREYKEGEDHDAVGYNTGEDYFETAFRNFESANDGDVTKGGGFTFYMPENRKNAKEAITNYQLREKQEKNNEHNVNGNTVVENGEYIYAAKYATYVEMTGSFRQDALGDREEKSAEVKYTIHLGYENDDAANFRSRRACDYTYNVKVLGVESIETEVETSDKETPTEGQPGAEGDVIKAKTYFYVDAHYGTQKITFNRGKITNSASFRVKTPYDPNGIDEAATDYKWVWFVQNDRKNVTTGYQPYNFYYDKGIWSKRNGRVYPAHKVEELEEFTHNGDKGYIYLPGIESGDVDFYCYKVKEIQLPIISEGVKYSSDFVPFPEEEAKRLDIKQLIGILKHEAFKGSAEAGNHPLPTGITEGVHYNSPLFDQNGDATFTVFIDEYYYDDETKKWQDFVNQPNREMHILCDTKYSQDQESSLTTSNFLISQKSIKTFYSLDNAETAWGVETIREGDLLYKGTINPSNASPTNGRWNMFNYMGGYTRKEWITYIASSSNELKPDYNKVAYACLQRNRDLDGNGTISDDEVRWYLPSINQMVGMWIGRNGFSSSEVYLFNGNTSTIENGTRWKYHFQNSNDIMFWAEEGAATGSNNDKNPLDYRCVRNLGGYYKDTPVKDKEPSDYISYDSGTRTFDLSKMNSKAIRTELYTGEIAVTDELNEANRPYKYFKVAKGLTTSSITQKRVYNGESPCKFYSEDGHPAGTWRMPNHRELMLIVSYVDKTSTTLSRTRSSLSKVKSSTDFGSVFYQQWGSIVNLYEGQDGTAFKVRCVKDVISK